MAKSKVVLVDDSETNRLVFKRLFLRHLPECVVWSASSAEEGIRLVAEIQPDCAILDVDLPGMNGIELCRYLKAQEDTARFPILLITALDSDAQLRVRGLEAGADDFLQQPYETPDLVAKIRVLLRIKRAEEELRAVNKRLAEVAEERSRALYESDARYRLLVDYGSDAVAVFELAPQIQDSRFVEVNNVAWQRMRYSRDEMLQLRLRDVIPANRITGVQGRIESILNHRQVFFETMLLRRDGQQIPVGVHARVFESDGRHTIIALARDLTGPPHAREPISESIARFRILTAQTGQMIYDSYLRTGTIKWGGAVTQVTGYTLGEMNSFDLIRWRDQIHTDDWKRVIVGLENAKQAVGKFQLEYRIRHKSGEYRHVEDVGVVLPSEDGKAYRVLGTVKDITSRVQEENERRRIEQEMQHSQKLESLGVLAGGIAHDFNNILAAIIGLTDMSLQELPKDSEVYQDLKEALQAAHRAKELVKQILTFSRQSGEERAPLFLHVVVREALKLLRASLPATIEIIDSVDVSSGAILANAAQMHQVIMNYCTNAAQAMNPKGGGVLEVRVVDVKLGEAEIAGHPKLRPGHYVKLSVSDTGHGMDEHVLKRIFDPFFTTKGPGEGTGMGLAVVHGIVSAHGGVIVVESKPGRGATFHTYFPWVGDPDLPREPEAETMPEGKERILFVDDEEGVRRFGESLLPRLGYTVVFCKSAHEALEVFGKHPERFDLVITDLIMPKMTGNILAKWVKELRPDIAIILFTGFSEGFSEEHLQDAGIQEIVMKPIVAMDLAKRIRKVLDARKAALGKPRRKS